MPSKLFVFFKRSGLSYETDGMYLNCESFNALYVVNYVFANMREDFSGNIGSASFLYFTQDSQLL